MFKVLFGDISNVRLMRLPYLGYSLLIDLLVIGFVFAVVLTIGAGEQIIGGNLQQAQDMLQKWFTLPFFIVIGLFMLSFVYAGFNIMAKRIRDIGLPGWWVLLAIIVLESVVTYTVSQQAGGNSHILITVVLLLIPSNTFAKGEASAN